MEKEKPSTGESGSERVKLSTLILNSDADARFTRIISDLLDLEAKKIMKINELLDLEIVYKSGGK